MTEVEVSVLRLNGGHGKTHVCVDCGDPINSTSKRCVVCNARYMHYNFCPNQDSLKNRNVGWLISPYIVELFKKQSFPTNLTVTKKQYKNLLK